MVESGDYNLAQSEALQRPSLGNSYYRSSLTNSSGNDNDGDNPLYVREASFISTDNSTSDNLAASEVFTGEWVEVLQFAIILIAAKSDVASATEGLCVEFSPDASQVVNTDCYTIPADTAKTYSFQPAGRYMRVKYTNGGSAQTSFTLETQLKSDYVKASSHKIGDTISGEDDSELVKAAITGEDSNGDWQNVKTTKDGNLTISDNSSGLAISKGDVTGHSVVQKFGNAPNFDSGDGIVTIWDGAEDGTAWELMNYNYSTTADIDSISSSNAGDTSEVTVIGLDADYNEVSQTVTLNGQTRVALTTSLIRVYRAFNANSVDFLGHVIIYVNGTLSGGVPTNNADIRAIIDPVNQQTEMAVYTIPAGKTGYLTRGYASTSGGNRNSNYVIRFYAREFGKVFRLQNVNSISDNASSIIVLDYFAPLKIPEKTDLEVRVETTESPITAASVSAGFDLVLVDN